MPSCGASVKTMSCQNKKDTIKVSFCFGKGFVNQLNAKTVHRTVFCQKCFTLLNFVVQFLLLLYKKKRTPFGVLSFWQGLC